MIENVRHPVLSPNPESRPTHYDLGTSLIPALRDLTGVAALAGVKPHPSLNFGNILNLPYLILILLYCIIVVY